MSHVTILKKILRVLYPRTLHMTRQGTWFLLLTLAVGIAAINTGNNLLYLILAMMLSLLIVSGILSEQCLKNLQIRRFPPAHLFAGTPFSVRLTVTNRKRLFPSFSLRILDLSSLEKKWIASPAPDGPRNDREEAYFFKILPGKTQKTDLSLLFPKRGLYPLEGFRLSTSYPFGLFIKAGRFPVPGELLIYPRLRPLEEFVEEEVPDPSGEEEIRQKGQGTSLYNLRAYQDGDEARTIHWKTSARLLRLMVRECEREEEKRIAIIISNHAPEDTLFERGIEFAASLSRHLLGRGFRLRLSSFSGDVPYGSGDAHLYRVLRHLALLQTVSRPVSDLLPQPHEKAFLILPWEDPFWAGRDASFSSVFRVSLLKTAGAVR